MHEHTSRLGLGHTIFFILCCWYYCKCTIRPLPSASAVSVQVQPPRSHFVHLFVLNSNHLLTHLFPLSHFDNVLWAYCFPHSCMLVHTFRDHIRIVDRFGKC